jgi:hypothetical protein
LRCSRSLRSLKYLSLLRRISPGWGTDLADHALVLHLGRVAMGGSGTREVSRAATGRRFARIRRARDIPQRKHPNPESCDKSEARSACKSPAICLSATQVQVACPEAMRNNTEAPPAAAALRAPIASPEFAEAGRLCCHRSRQGDAAEDTAEIQRAAHCTLENEPCELDRSISVLFQQAHSSPAPWAARSYVRH